MDPGALLRAAADRLEAEAGRATRGAWAVTGLLATRPEIVAFHDDGSTEHVAEARAASARWIALSSPALAAPLATWLRVSAQEVESGVTTPALPAAIDVACAVLDRPHD